MRVRIPKIFVLSLLSLLLSHLTLAQTTNGSIRGTVTDPNGAVLSNVTVTVKNAATGFERRLTTTDEGTYLADNLPPGEYEIQLEAQGFQRQIKRVTVLTSNSVETNFSLTVGANTETVVITSDAAQVNTSDYKVDGVITRERIENLPLNGRSFLSLASLEPGVDVTFDANPGAGGVNNYFRGLHRRQHQYADSYISRRGQCKRPNHGRHGAEFLARDGAGIPNLNFQFRPVGREHVIGRGKHRFPHRRQ